MSIPGGPDEGEETIEWRKTPSPHYPAGSWPTPGAPPPMPAGSVPQGPPGPPWQGPGPQPVAQWPGSPPPPPPPWQAPGSQPPFPYAPGGPGSPPGLGAYPPPPRRPRWRWWVAGAVAAVVTVLVITLVVLGHGEADTKSATPSSARPPAAVRPVPASPSPSASAPPAQPGVDIAALPSLLASAQQVGQVLDHVSMNAHEVDTTMATGVTVDPATCSSAVAPVLESTYAGSGYTGMAGQGLDEAQPGRHRVFEAVVAFPDEAAAQHFYAQQLSAWKGCKLTGVTVTYRNGHPDDHAKITIVSEIDHVASTVLLPAGATEHQDSECERAMSARRNVFVDVRACGPNTIVKGIELVRAIDANITKQP